MTDTTTFTPHSAAARMGLSEYQTFFDRLAMRDYHALAKELNISKPTTRPAVRASVASDVTLTDGEISFDSLDGHTFEPTVEGLERAVSLLRGPASPVQQTPEEEEAFQFTFRLMIHKLYSIRDFAKMVDDVVRTSQERFQALPPDLTSRRASFSFAYAGDGDSFMSAGSLASPTETTLPSSPSLLSDRSLEVDKELEGDARALKKRCIGRKLSVVDTENAGKNDGPAWLYDSAVVSVDSPSYAAFIEGLPTPPAMESPYDGAPDEGDHVSRKRRFSFLDARGL